MTALSSDLADALTAVTTALGDTLRTVRFEHAGVVFDFERHAIRAIPATGYCYVTSGRTQGKPVEKALDRLGVEVYEWHLAVLAQAVEDTDWTRGTEATP